MSDLTGTGNERTQNETSSKSSSRYSILAGEAANQAPAQVITGKLVGPFDPKVTSWDLYEQMMRYQMELRGLTDEKTKKLVVVTEIGLKAYGELINALEGKDLKDVETADELLRLLGKRFKPRKLLIAERHRMMSLKQEVGQSLAEFYSRIQEGANACELKTEFRDILVVQVFVKGIRCERTRVHLLQEEKLTPTQALEKAQVMEMAEAEGHGMTSGPGHMEEGE
ncbi:hypothetical protein AAVH_12251 [Aphelenchoides avenae]|nr:hypothetical protein AAVH_12251 [Aphelenchus avenae]